MEDKHNNENDALISNPDALVQGRDGTSIQINNQTAEHSREVYEPLSIYVCDERKEIDVGKTITNVEVHVPSIIEIASKCDHNRFEGSMLIEVMKNTDENTDVSQICNATEESQSDYKTELLASINKIKASKTDSETQKTNSSIPTPKKLKLTDPRTVPLKGQDGSNAFVKNPKNTASKFESGTENELPFFNETAMDDFNKTIKKQQNDIKSLNSQVNEHKIIIESQSEEITGYLNQIKLLETALKDEQAFHKSNTNRLKSKGPHISESEAMQLSKEINEQEFLIKGVCISNISLLLKMRNWSKKLKNLQKN
jgi:hypothetical protein